MAEFRGTDPVVPFLNYARRVKEGWKYRLLLKDTDLAVDDVVESGAFRIRVDSQYERHYRRSYVLPASGEGDVSPTGPADPGESVDPDRPGKHEYTDTERAYPRRATARTIDCDFCTGGSNSCPNCETESVVTCPDCHTHRGGDCANCDATGKVDCGDCGGSGTCSDCGGGGTVRCSGCSGTGTVEETKTKTRACPNCNGTGSRGGDRCSACNGSGETTERVTHEVQHMACDGTGRQTCRKCGGSGNCPTCTGSGLVTCSVCNGSRVCQRCNGDGVKRCPTCAGNGRVTCPLCEGDRAVFAYTEDRYEYEHTVEEDTVFPDEFESYRDQVSFGDTSAVPLDALTGDQLREQFGLLNSYLRDQLGAANEAFDRLTAKTRGREFDDGIGVDDRAVQDRLFSELKANVQGDWDRRPSDSFGANYRATLSSSARRHTHDDDYKNILFERYRYRFVPMSLLTLRMGEARKELFTVGTREEYDVDSPSFDVDPVKAATAVVGVGALLWAAMVSPLAGGPVPTIGGTAVPWYAALAAGGVGSLLGYAYRVYRTISSDDADVVTVVGPDDALNTTFLSVLAHTVAREGDGEVRGRIYTKLSENLFEELQLGASLTYAVEFEDGPDVRLVGLSAASYDRMDAETRKLVEDSEGVVGVFGEDATAGDLERFGRIVDDDDDDGDGEVAVITEDTDLAADRGPDCRTYEVPLDRLREGYLQGDAESEVTVLESVDRIREMA